MFGKKIYNYQTYIAILMTIGAVILVGCKDQLLNKTPRGQQTLATYFETENDAIQSTNGTYELLTNFDRSDGFWSSVHFIWYLGMTDIASDDANKGTVPTDGTDVGRLDQVVYDPAEQLFNEEWKWFYQIIYRANLAIQKIPDVDMNETLKQRLIGENKFIRAYAYFFLVRMWGGVPLVTEPLEPGNFDQTRASAGDVYSSIEQDLQEAANSLPLKSEYSAADLGRATKGAAQGLLAKVYISQDKFEDAENMAENVINSGEYMLLPDYDKIFTPEGENSSGSIFEIQAAAVADGSGGTNYSNPQGVRGQPNLGWGFNSPERNLLNDYEPGDPRMESTVMFVHETLPSGPEDAVRDNPQAIDERYNQKAFIPLDNPGGNLNGGSNIRRLRYSDVLLIAAEAAYHNGHIADAQNYTNMVRERARGGQTATIGIEPEALAGLVADTMGMSSLYMHPFIRWVNPGGPADAAGLKPIDWELVATNSQILINNIDMVSSIDGVDVSSVQEYRSEMQSMTPGQPVTIGIQRITESYNAGTKTTNSEDLQFIMTTQALLPDITSTGQQLLEDIWHERRIELALEQQRMFDIRRQDRTGELLRAEGKNFMDGRDELYPIPTVEIQLDPELEQNPGYN